MGSEQVDLAADKAVGKVADRVVEQVADRVVEQAADRVVEQAVDRAESTGVALVRQEERVLLEVLGRQAVRELDIAQAQALGSLVAN